MTHNYSCRFEIDNSSSKPCDLPPNCQPVFGLRNSVAIGSLKPAARDLGVDATARATAVARGNCGFFAGARSEVWRRPKACDLLAVQAVCCELVSPIAISLFAGKKQGISAKSGGFGRLTSRKRAVVQCVTGEIPYGQEQGIFSNPDREYQGNIRDLKRLNSRFLGPRMRHRVRSQNLGVG